MGWHVPLELLVAYEQGRLDPVRVMAVEAHVARCARCRESVPSDEDWLARSWAGVLDTVDAPRLGVVERLLCRLGMPGHRARLLAATPALRASWLAATAAVLSFAVLATYLSGGASPVSGSRAVLGFLAVAPVLPVLAVATAYGSRLDGLHEISDTTPMAGPALVLWRASAVLVVSIGMGGLASVFLPGHGWLAVAWLLPALALCLASLALATVVPSRVTAPLLAAGWLVVVVAVGTRDEHGDVFGTYAQVVYLLVAVAAGAVLAARRRRLDPGEPR